MLIKSPIQNKAQFALAAKQLGRKFNTNILIKGGHIKDIHASDVMYSVTTDTCHWFQTKRIRSNHTHGTGCTLSSAIASYLAQGYDLVKAVKYAKSYLTKAISFGKKLKIGKGFGPVDHFYFLRDLP